MTVIPVASTQTAEASTVKLAEYAQSIQVCECAFWGIRNSPCPDREACRDVWMKPQRDEIAYYLAEAQEELEREVGFFIGHKWITAERWPYSAPIQARWGYIVSGGVRAESDIGAGAAVDYTGTDPAVVGPIATTVTDEDEVKIYHAGTDIEIDPSDITIASGAVTITIPRCRLVDPSVADNPANGLNYNDITNFAATVDVKRVYNNTATQATLIRSSCLNDCDVTEANACMQVRYDRISSIYAPYSTTGLCGCCPDFVELNYLSGTDMTKQARDAIIRLAHSKMPRNPCDCSPIDEFWKRDRHVPDVLTAERENCPFGMSDGAWIAWRWAMAMALVRGVTL
jgi:hypothetical protein